ncbi:MAG: membrane protein insertion efficiency factor YidD [Candidatus Magasanikbacteria bacterium]|nr:membrane protein insertion efficiency factor YidD [Candidatus Magasanikbacteria bacterium]MBT4220971.1 membrane protein insertion efficiency factor YidD [Candidatus Magasanikbacteria bacterium]MBT4350489.1 membrane protein insertion efficiency factor YidD [Candidatus Magasanikbacteria bacterium]MBT4541958.1 membrane protein insertion efficiency factor YidD [Candidatus Magasanikbacteria bacterium]MBT6252876.1 membrane protein insertion efficiency factor YidD [Candidatus Magasanikbacteria bact
MISVRLYQLLFSPDHSFWAKDAFPEGYCKFYPTCSEYGHQVFFKYGVFRGGIKTVWRILRCNPWSAGGIDKP